MGNGDEGRQMLRVRKTTSGIAFMIDARAAKIKGESRRVILKGLAHVLMSAAQFGAVRSCEGRNSGVYFRNVSRNWILKICPSPLLFGDFSLLKIAIKLRSKSL
jgi:hypothetical protein